MVAEKSRLRNRAAVAGAEAEVLAAAGGAGSGRGGLMYVAQRQVELKKSDCATRESLLEYSSTLPYESVNKLEQQLLSTAPQAPVDRSR